MRNSLKVILCFILLCLSACVKNKESIYQGYAEGRFTYIYVDYPGKLEKLAVARGDKIQKNNLLFILSPEPEKSSEQQIKADLLLAQKSFDRQTSLLKQNATSTQAFDQAKSNLDQLQAKLHQIQWQIQEKTVYAPKTGEIFDTYFLQGEWVATGQPVLSLLAPDDIKIIFFIDEPSLGKINLNQQVLLNCDGCTPNQTGRIVFISPKAEYTPPVIYSDERREKLTYRIEAQPDHPELFHPGQPVKVYVKPNA